MDITKIREWEQSVDRAEQTSMVSDLPTDYPIGKMFIEPIEDGKTRHWQRVEVLSGNVGARWAYWVKSYLQPGGVRPESDFHVVADKIFNGDATHFAGMLGIPYTGRVPGMKHIAWMLVYPKMTPPPETKEYEEKPRVRYEKSKEVYDLETHTAHDLGHVEEKPEVVVIPEAKPSARKRR